MSLPWLKVHKTLPDHRKSKQLEREIGERNAFGYVMRLWMWCLDNAPEGRISGKHLSDIVEDAAGWRGEPGRLFGALLEFEWIERSGDAVAVHDWEDFAGAHIKRAEQQAVEKRERRSRSGSSFPAAVDVTDGVRTACAENKTSCAESEPKDGTASGRPAPVSHPSISISLSTSQMSLEGVQGEAKPEDLQAAWNELAPPLPKWREMPPARKALAKTRLRERPMDGPDGWRAVIKKIAASSFLRGDTGNWKATPKWLLKPDTAANVLEGQYDDRTPPNRAPDVSRGVVRAQDINPEVYQQEVTADEF